MADWWIYKGVQEPHDGIERLPTPPHWRRPKSTTDATATITKAEKLALKERFAKAQFQVGDRERDAINAALYLRRPLLVTGPPGTGKSTLAYAVAYELNLGQVLQWPITTRATLQDALYRYDAIGRLQEANLPRDQPDPKPPAIGQFIRLGPLGTAFLPRKYPRVLLIDEIDKSDIDLPNDLLHILEQGEFEIPELSRLAKQTDGQSEVAVNIHGSDQQVNIVSGKVAAHAFPFVVMTSNGEREFPPPFLRRCIRLNFEEPKPDLLEKIVSAYFTANDKGTDPTLLAQRHRDLIEKFVQQRSEGYLATDQLLNAIFLATSGVDEIMSKEELIKLVMQPLSNTGR
jgi:MoxR-like ATPase